MNAREHECCCRYKKNEVFLDVVESVNLLVNSNGTVVRSEVVGALKMRTFLSGMPECKLGLNDKVSKDLSRVSRNRQSCSCSARMDNTTIICLSIGLVGIVLLNSVMSFLQ